MDSRKVVLQKLLMHSLLHLIIQRSYTISLNFCVYLMTIRELLTRLTKMHFDTIKLWVKLALVVKWQTWYDVFIIKFNHVLRYLVLCSCLNLTMYRLDWRTIISLTIHWTDCILVAKTNHWRFYQVKSWNIFNRIRSFNC
jgi:hypothetical protein